MPVPLFPLHTVLFPGALLPLVVFEERYRAMMRDLLAGDRTFMVAAIRAGAEVGGHAETFDVGCLALIEQVERRPDGSMDLVARGTGRVLITERLPDDPYPRAEVTSLPEESGPVAEAALSAGRRSLNRYLRTLAAVTGRGLEAPAVPQDPVAASYAMASSLEVDKAERQAMLEAPTAAARLRLAREIARREAALLEAVGPPAGRLGAGFSEN